MYKVLGKRTYREWAELSETEKDTHKHDYRKSSLCRRLNEIGCADVSLFLKARLDELGLPADDVAWSLGCCQGGGVAFYGKVPLTEKLLVTVACAYATEPRFKALRYLIATGTLDVTYNLSRNSFGHRYTHGRCIQCDVWDVYGGDTSRLSGIGGTSQKIEGVIYEVEILLLEYVRSVCDKLESTGYQLLESVLEEEHIADFCLANGILFDEEGRAIWGARELIDCAQKEPVIAVEIQGGVISDAYCNMECRLLVMDHDAEIMDPQGHPEMSALFPEVSPARIVSAEEVFKRQEEIREMR